MITEIRNTAIDYLSNNQIVGKIGKLGAFGKVTFRVSENNVLVPKEYSGTVSNEITYHPIIGRPPISEFIGRKLETINFDIKLIFSLAPIKQTLADLREMVERGEHHPLVLGNEKIGENNFVIRTMNYKITKTDPLGNPLVAEVSLSLEEYIENIDNTATEKFVDTKGVEVVDDKVIYNMNSELIKTLKGGRQW